MHEERIAEIEALMASPDFWKDPVAAQRVIREYQNLKDGGTGDGHDAGSATIGILAGAGGDDAEDFARRFETLMHTVVHMALLSGFCYTQFTDVFQEANGLLSADRTPKIPLERIAKAVRESRTHIQGVV